jgi:hypothetical protein
MKDVFFMEVSHSQRNVFDKTDQEFFRQLFLLFVQTVKETASTKELCDQSILIVIDAHAHIEHNARVMKLADDLNFFDKVRNVLVSESSFFEVFFHCNFLTKQFSEKDLTIPSFSNRFDDLQLFFFDEES